MAAAAQAMMNASSGGLSRVSYSTVMSSGVPSGHGVPALEQMVRTKRSQNDPHVHHYRPSDSPASFHLKNRTEHTLPTHTHARTHARTHAHVHTHTYTYIHTYIHTSGWIFQKVLAEIVQKGLILSQKSLISNRRNFGFFAPKSMRFSSTDRKSKDLSL